ncbi:MAG: NAD-dependent epimerase/dehydratase family protein [Proteobacteria bacterium]|nr:NAD-dependent epimerase/dehydratase family protein [Pseudomonadota bacterium]
MSSRTCLVTGGAGFIGCAMSALLAERFGRVVAMDNLHPQVHAQRTRPPALDARVELVEADVCSADAWDRLLDRVRPEVIVHLAAETGTGQSLTQATRHAETNVVGATRMLDALARHDALPERIVLASSRAVYGEGAWRAGDGRIEHPGQRDAAMLARAQWDFPGLQALPHEASATQPHPTSVYGATKLAQEHVLGAWALAFGVRPWVLRLQNVYGVGQSLSNPYTGIVPLFCRLAREGRSIPVYEDGAIVRDFVCIDDVARALLAATDADVVANKAIDIGSAEAITILDLARWIARRYGAPAPMVNGSFRHGDVRHACARIERAREHLHWQPSVTLDAGLERLCTWIDGCLDAAEAGASSR